jgi:hypothetical protein
MRRVALFVCLAIVASALAQEGHPLTGAWTGDWSTGPAAPRNHITLVMNWDGDKVSGVINPGPDSTAMQSVVVDYTKWTVRIEAEGKDASGKPVRIEAEGRFENLGSPHRSLTGKWTQGTVSGEFKVTRE